MTSDGLGSRKLLQAVANVSAVSAPSSENRSMRRICMAPCSLEAGREAEGDLPHLRIRTEVDPLSEVRGGVLADLGIITGVVRDREEILRADVQLQPRHGLQVHPLQPGGREVVTEAEILPAEIGAVFDE